MSEEKSYVRNERGEITHVDYSNSDTGRTYRYETYYPGSSTPRELVGVQGHSDGEFRETAGTDIFGNPIYT